MCNSIINNNHNKHILLIYIHILITSFFNWDKRLASFAEEIFWLALNYLTIARNIGNIDSKFMAHPPA